MRMMMRGSEVKGIKRGCGIGRWVPGLEIGGLVFGYRGGEFGVWGI